MRISMTVAATLMFALAAIPVFSTGMDEQVPAEEPTLVFLHHFLGGNNPEHDQVFLDTLYEKSGIRVHLVKPTDSEDEAVTTAMLAAGEQLDLVYLDPDNLDVWVTDNPGLFEPLEDRIAKSPVFSDTKKFPPEAWDSIRYKDGHVYGTVPIAGLASGATLPIVRWDWVENVGMADRFDGNTTPSLGDYYDLLEAFATQDPDGNGKDDTYGLALGYTSYDASPFFGAYGLERMFTQDAQGNVQSPWSFDKSAPVWEFLARLYANHILEPNFVTNNSGAFRELFMTGQAGMIVYWDNWIPRLNDTVLAENPDSPFDARPLYPPMEETQYLRRSGGSFVSIPSTSKYKDLAFKVLEFFGTDEGALLGTAGTEGYDYNIVNGKIVFTQVGQEMGQNHGMKPGWAYDIPWDIAPQWKQAFDIMPAVAGYLQQGYGFSESQWEDASGPAEARMIRGEVSVADGLKEMRDRLRQDGLIK